MRAITTACLLVVMPISGAVAQGPAPASYCVSIGLFGGAGDNSTDNTTALNSALASLSATGGCIYFPAGKYRFNSGVGYTMPAGIFSVTIVGDGQDVTILKWPTAVTAGLTFNYTSLNNSVHVKSLSMTTGAAAGGVALSLSQTLSDVDPAFTALSDVSYVTFRGDDSNVPSTDYWSTDVGVANVANINFISDLFVGDAGANSNGVSLVGLPASATYGVVYNFIGSTFGNKAAGIIYGSYIQGVTVSQCNFTGGTYGIISLGAQAGVLAQLSVVNSQFGGLTSNAILSGTAIVDTQISNSLFIVQNANANAIFLQSNAHFTISNNLVTASTNNNTNGIVMGSTVSGAKGVITGNDIFGFTTCVYLQPGSSNIAVVSNSLLFGCINAVVDSGTNNTTSPNYN